MQKQLIAFDNWKRQSHPNLVQLREMFQTRAFGDNCKFFSVVLMVAEIYLYIMLIINMKENNRREK